MIVKVIYPSDGSQEKSRIVFYVDTAPILKAPNASYMLQLEAAFRLTNRVNESDNKRMDEYAKQNGVKSIRSSMVGDVFIVGGNYYICDSISWEKIKEEDVEKWMNLPSTDRLMGVRYAMAKILEKVAKGFE